MPTQQQQRGRGTMPISEDSSLFTPIKRPLIKVLCEYNNISQQDPYYTSKLAEAFQRNGRNMQDYVGKLELRTNHLRPDGRNFPLQAAFITRKSACSLMAFKGGMGASVQKFYYLRHRLRLRFPQFPCVAVKGGKEQVSFYPLEVIDVIQSVANEQEEEKMTMMSTTTADVTTQTDDNDDADEQEEGSNGFEEENEEEEEERQLEGTIIIKIAKINF